MAVQSGNFLTPQPAMLTAKGRLPAVRLCPRWTSGSGTTLTVRVSSNEGNKKTASVPNSNYVVPLDNSVASSCITRPLAEILRDLNKRIPDNIINTDDAIASTNLIPWYHANRMLSFYAPGWCGEIRDVIFSENGSVTVVYRVNIKAAAEFGVQGIAMKGLEVERSVGLACGSWSDGGSTTGAGAITSLCCRLGVLPIASASCKEIFWLRSKLDLRLCYKMSLDSPINMIVACGGKLARYVGHCEHASARLLEATIPP
ncbi:hypothetical protein Acr_06g0000090 [Actinidia rufa]|uniref:Uncharacterized protein n=1 Tax=Actinidia rufa TaxID=165716 RepID=A0A7J0EPX4_9ERIC|nr:hypothetical protein Acr_06g0000090 [Actinidia rufa]